MHEARLTNRWPSMRTADEATPSPVAAETCCPPLLGAGLEVAEAEQLAAAFAALADPVRLRLLSLVAEAGEVCSCNLEGPLGKSQPTISHHTKTLAEAGLLTGEKRGRWVWWSVVPERIAVLRAALDDGRG
jgi:ArsR family transcriptional regulator, arsenate/arsenite/antimonite-responsive transcriptional repressor